MTRVNILSLARCESTNDYLRDHAADLWDQVPVLITSREQTRGRGRGENRWFSTPGAGLTSSLGIRLTTSHKIGLLSMAAAAGVADTLLELHRADYTLKWPNDILCGGKKIAGILVENIFFGEDIFCIIGTGINLNQQEGDFPTFLQGKAISLKMISGREYPPDGITPKVADRLLRWIRCLRTGDTRPVLDRVKALSRGMINQPVAFRNGSPRRIHGVFRGIRDDGGARIEVSGGREKIFYSGEILDLPHFGE